MSDLGSGEDNSWGFKSLYPYTYRVDLGSFGNGVARITNKFSYFDFSYIEIQLLHGFKSFDNH